MAKKSSLFIILILLQSHAVLPFLAGSPIGFTGPVYDGPELDYMPAIVRMHPGGDLMLVFERIDPSSFFGDFYITFSTDNGRNWSLPQQIIPSERNQRHPALVQLQDGSFALFYLEDETGSGAYRIYRATSPDGISWSSRGVINLGWDTSGEINPGVICEADGTLTMTYHRLYGPGYIARSTDSGETWDTLKTRISSGNAALPRLAKREYDGLYLVTYQTGSSNLDLWAKITADPYDWSGDTIPLSTAINSHDSQPIVLEDGTFLVTYARQTAQVFDIFYKTSADGEIWSDAIPVTSDSQHYDTQPHPLLQGTPGHVILTWSHQKSPTPYQDHDVWINTDLSLSLPPPDKVRIVTGPGPGPSNAPLVRTFDPENPVSAISEWMAYGVQMYGVNVSCGNLHGSGGDAVITAPGPGAVFGPHVRAFTATGFPYPGVSFLAYGTRKYGTNVTAGNIDGDPFDEIITGPGPGAVFGPHVRGWDYDDAGFVLPVSAVNFMAYGTRKWGVQVACGDADGDGYDEIITGAGPGAVFGPHIRGWNYDGSGSTSAIPGINFMAYGTRKYGVHVAAGNLTDDGSEEIISGAGPGIVFAAHIRGWNYDGQLTSAMPGVNYFAYPADASRYGVLPCTVDLDRDGMDEILTMPGPDPGQPAIVRGWNVDGGSATPIEGIDFSAYGDLNLSYGGKIAGGFF